ncbi:hypothetical protein GWK08_17490 [Leptobacterium flavescens]|uniref:Membrane metalloprotease n=1 Tax=Leptobacterium flavescens TaxID=472055 RepID=A0A6P0UPJ2_9FLAO|nr:hypothetical protein [Leptobacterium flavescens]NER15254.1 hypothetical protein [Leptobacterium flavescens]
MEMKKYVSALLWGLFLVILITACSNDDDSVSIEETPLSEEVADEDAGNNERVDRTPNLQGLGESARDLLSDENFTRVVVEIVSVRGFAPSAQSVENLVDFIEERTFKPDGVRVVMREIAPPDNEDDEYSVREIAEIEGQVRTQFNNGNEIAVFMFFADAPSVNDSDTSVTLGTAYRNTSLVFYERTIRRLGTNNNLGISLTTVETAVMHHEYAHIMGLVDVGTPLLSDHLDEENGGHCNVPGCLMRASLEFGTADQMMEMMAGNRVPLLDPLCIADLRGNGGR